MTAHATTEERERCVAAGMVDHVSKPIDPAALYDVLGRFRPAGPALAPAVPAPAPVRSTSAGAAGGGGAGHGAGPAARGRQPIALREACCGSSWPSRRDAAERDPREPRPRRPGGGRARWPTPSRGSRGTSRRARSRPRRARWRRRSATASSPRAWRRSAARLAEALGRLSSALRPRAGRPGASAESPRPRRPLRRPTPPCSRALVERWARLLAECDAGTIDGLERGGRPAPRPLRRRRGLRRVREAGQRLRLRGRPRSVAARRRREGNRGIAMAVKDLSECRVLIVDDVKANVDMLVEALRGDYKLSVALDGEAALRAVEKSPPDLLLLDIVMPGHRRLRGVPAAARRPRHPRAPHHVPELARGRPGQGAGLRAGGERLPHQALRDPGGEGAGALAAEGQGLRRRDARGAGARPRHRPRDPDGHPPLRPRRAQPRARGSTSTPSSSRRGTWGATSSRSCASPTTGWWWRWATCAGRASPPPCSWRSR